MIPFLSIIFFVLGLVIGSFLNVVICRYNTARSFGGRSACMSCRSTLSWYELVPLLSYLCLRGRCNSCQTRISAQYPLVEFVTGLLFLALFLKFQDMFFAYVIPFAITYAYYAAIFSLLVVIAVYDYKHKIIPDGFSLMFGALAFIGLFFFESYGLHPHLPNLYDFLAGPLIAIPFAGLWLLSRGTWMGLGDAKLAVGLGWLLGLSRALSGVVLAFWIGAIIGIILVIFGRVYGMKSEIPLAPFLVLGAIAAFLFELHIFYITI